MTDEMGPLCGGKSHHMERFMEACLLLFLSQDIGHGYSMLEQLRHFGFEADQINVSTLYRTLRKMEAAGAVTSDWEEGGPGPKRRVYHITEQGLLFLQNWIDVLKMRRLRISKLIDAYEAVSGEKNNQI